MTKVKTNKTNSSKLVALTRWQELGLLVILVLILGFSMYSLMYLVTLPFMMLGVIMIMVFSIYSIVGIGRGVYTRLYLVSLAIMAIVVAGIITVILVGYLKDVFGASCAGKFNCADTAAFQVYFLRLFAIIPLAILSLVAMVSQIRASSKQST